MEEKEKTEIVEEGAGEEDAGGKKSFLKWIIIAVVAFVLMGGGVFLGIKMKLLPLAGTETVAVTEKPEEDMGKMYPLDTFIVNLAGGKGKRYLKVKMDLELDHEKVEQEIKMKMSRIRDRILMLLSSKSFQQIESMEGKDTLREEIIARISGLVTSGKIRSVYFTDFVVQ